MRLAMKPGMRPGVFARSAAVTVVLALVPIACSSGAEESPTAGPPPSPTALAAPVAASGTASDAVPGPASDSAGAIAAESPSLEDRLAAMDVAMAGIMLGEFPDAEEIAEIAMASSLDSEDSGDLEGRAISAVSTENLIDDQGNLPQPVVGDALIDFTLPLAGGGELTLSEIGGDQNTVLVFYRAFW